MKLCRADEIPELEARGFNVEGRKLFAVKKRGMIFVYENSCPHVGITLEYNENDFLDYDKNFIICSGHGALFSIEIGYCVAGPCRGRSLRKIEYRIEDGWVELADQVSPFSR